AQAADEATDVRAEFDAQRDRDGVGMVRVCRGRRRRPDTVARATPTTGAHRDGDPGAGRLEVPAVVHGSALEGDRSGSAGCPAVRPGGAAASGMPACPAIDRDLDAADHTA